MNLRVGVRANRPLILRDRAGLVQILSAHTAWMLLREGTNVAGWKTLCKKGDGTTGWLPVKRLVRFQRDPTQVFGELQTPMAQMQALSGKDAATARRSDREEEPAQGLEQLKPLRGVDLPDTIDLQPELSAGMRASACFLPFSCAQGLFGPCATKNFGRMKLTYKLGSNPLLALTRVAAAYVANAHISQSSRRLGPLRNLVPEGAPILDLRCRYRFCREVNLYCVLKEDISMLTSDSRCFELQNSTVTYTPSIIATLVLLCGHVPHVRVPSFILNGDEAIREEFFSVLNRFNGMPPDSRTNIIYTLRTCVAGGVSYMLGQQVAKSKVFISEPKSFGNYTKLVAFCEEDPFDRGANTLGRYPRHGPPPGRFAYAIEACGSDHFVDGLSRVPVFNSVPDSARGGPGHK